MPVLVYFVHKGRVRKDVFVINVPLKQFKFPCLKTQIFRKLGLDERITLLFVRAAVAGRFEVLEPSMLKNRLFKKAEHVHVFLGTTPLYGCPLIPDNPIIHRMRMVNDFRHWLDEVKHILGLFDTLPAVRPTPIRIQFIPTPAPMEFPYPARRASSSTAPANATTSTERKEMPKVKVRSEVEEVLVSETPEAPLPREVLELDYRRNQELSTPRRPLRLTREQYEDQKVLMDLTLMNIIEHSRDCDLLVEGLKKKDTHPTFYNALAYALAVCISSKTKTLKTKNEIYDVIEKYLQEYKHLDIRELLGPYSRRLIFKLSNLRRNQSL